MKMSCTSIKKQNSTFDFSYFKCSCIKVFFLFSLHRL